MAFEYKEFPLALDLVEGTSAQSSNKKISLSQRDIGVSKILFSLTFRNVAYPIPVGAKVRLFIKRYNSGIVMQDQTAETGAHVVVTDADNGKIEVLLNSDSIANAGQAEAQIEIELAVGKIMTSQKFSFFIEAALGANGGIVSGNDIPLLDKALEAGEKLKDIDLDAVISVTEDVQNVNKKIEDMAINVTSRGAKGDGTDDTTAIQNTLNELKARGGGLLLLPEKSFVVSNLKIPSYCGIVGTGRKSILKAKDNSGMPVIELEAPDTKFTYLSDFSIIGNKANQTSQNAKGIFYNGSESGSKDPVLNEWDARHVIKNIFIKETKGVGFTISGRGESQIDNIQVRDCADYGIVFDSFDNWISNISSGSNLKTGIVITSRGGSSRYINCKSWNNGQGATSIDDTYGFKLTGVQGAILSACDAQANLNHGVYMSDIRGCFIHVNSELNGSRGLGLVTPDAAGFFLEGGMYNNIIGTCRNIRNDQQIQDYAVSLSGSANANNISITSMAMNKGGVNDLNNRLSSNNVSVIADTANYTDVSSRTRRYDVLGVGTGANKAIAPIWVTSKDTDNAQGSLFQRLTANSGSDNTLATFESINGTEKATLKVKANITNKQIIYDSTGNEARFTNTVKSNDKLIGTNGLGVGNTVSATSLGTVIRKMEVFNANGTSIGFVPIYNSIT